MSRNKEKAQSALNRYQQELNREAGVLESNPNLRPKYVQSVESLPQAEKWRNVVVSEISSKLTIIQDPIVGEDQIRELNETINKLFKEKRAWEYHIKSLGGPDHIRFGDRLQSTGMLDDEVSGIKGFRYFGRAKDLPEVKLLKQAHIDKTTRETAEETSNNEKERDLEARFNGIAPDYYEQFHGDYSQISTKLLQSIAKQGEKVETDIIDYKAGLPSSEEIKQFVVQKKKEELLSKISSINS